MEPYQTAYRQAVRALAGLDLEEAGRLRGASLEGRRLLLPFFGQPVQIEVPADPESEAGFLPSDLPVAERILILHYLGSAASASRPGSGRMVSFQQLPGASFYEPTYRKRGPARIARRFGLDPEAFRRACRALGWTTEPLGDAAFGCEVFPLLRAVVVLHRGDEEFPAEVNLLYSEAVVELLPLEDVAVLAGLIATRLSRAAQGSSFTG